MVLALLFLVTLICSQLPSANGLEDCHPEPGATEEECNRRGCIWDRSPSLDSGIPWCSYAPVPHKDRRDCHPEPGATEEECNRKGCIWDRSPSLDSGIPWCSYAPVPHKDRRDCHPEPGATEEECNRRGCIWDRNPSLDSGIPWCFYPPEQGCIPSMDSENQISPQERVDCSPFPGGDEEECKRNGCIWDACPSHIPSAPHCYFPLDRGYKVKSEQEQTITLEKDPVSWWYGKDTTPLTLVWEEIGKTLRVRIGAPNRYEPPLDLSKESSESDDGLQFVNAAQPGSLFSFKVLRDSTKRILFDSSIGGLVFADQFIQIATFLPSQRLYGLGENPHLSLQHNMSEFKTWPMFARDEGPNAPSGQYKNLYGVHPFYLSVEPDGKCHGVLILNSNAQEYTTGPGPSLVYRTIGGLIDLYFFPGPSPEEVVEQYMALVGKPTLPGYWAFGFQLSRWGYNTLDDVKAVIKRTTDAGIPFDVQWLDLDYMEMRQDFTYDKFTHSMRASGMRTIMIVDPAIPADYEPMKRGMEKQVFIRWADKSLVPDLNNQYESTRGSDVMLGTVWPDKNTAFPDWLAPNTTDWWTDEIRRFYDIVPFDGLWIDMNEPANFATNDPNPWYWADTTLGHAKTPQLWCPHDQWEFPPYQTWAVYVYEHLGDKTARLSQKTLCMNAMHASGLRHYDVHSLYGMGESKASLHALNSILGKRSLLQVCSRNHNLLWSIPQDPAVWPTVADATRKAMNFRYHYMPYLYSLFFESSLKGKTVVRPLFFEFPLDRTARGIDRQFLWGDAMLISPVLDHGVRSLKAYLPWYGPSKCYSLFDANYGKAEPITGWRTFPTPLTSLIPVHVRGGSILPRQAPAKNTHAARMNPLEILVALDSNYKAWGFLYWDDGETLLEKSNGTDKYYYHIEMSYYETDNTAVLNFTSNTNAATKDVVIPTLDIIEIFGYNHIPVWDTFAVNGKAVQINKHKSKMDFGDQRLYVAGEKIIHFDTIEAVKSVILTWSHMQPQQWNKNTMTTDHMRRDEL